MPKIMIAPTFLQRLEQTFTFYFKNIHHILTLPLIIYLGVFIDSLIITYFEKLFPELFQNIWFASFLSLVVLALIIITITLPLFSILHTTSTLIKGKKTDFISNLIISLKSFFPFLKALSHLTLYLFLIPTILFIISAILIYTVPMAGVLLLTFTKMFSLVFILYRLPKSFLFLSHCVEKKKFTKKELKDVLKLTSGKWWKTTGNILTLAFITFTFSFIIFVIKNYSLAYLGINPFYVIENPLELRAIAEAIFRIILQSISISFSLVFMFFLYKSSK